MSRRRRAILLLGLSLVLGGLAWTDVSRREAALRDALGPPVSVVVARAELPPGRRLRPTDLALRRFPSRYAPVGAADLPGELIGRRLAAGVPRGGAIGAGHLELPSSVTGPPVGRGERAADIVGLGSPALIVPGARIDVLVTRDAEAGAPGRTELALQDVEVLEARRAADADGRDGAGERVQATLRVSVRDAVFLAAAQSFAREIRLLPRAPGDRARSRPLRVGEGLP